MDQINKILMGLPPEARRRVLYWINDQHATVQKEFTPADPND
jgi:hypothetical protein